MFCPQCGCEFADKIKECSDCGVPLVKEPPAKTLPQRTPKLKQAVLAALLGIIYTFTARTIGTFFPEIFSHIRLAHAHRILFFLACTALVYFFMVFSREYVNKNRRELKTGVIIAVLGSSLLLLAGLPGLMTVFGTNNPFSPGVRRALDSFVPFVVGLSILLFFCCFLRDLSKKEEKLLKRPLVLAVIGAGIYSIFKALCLVNWLFFRTDLLTQIYAQKFLYYGLGVPLVVFIFITEIYFFLTFYKNYENLKPR